MARGQGRPSKPNPHANGNARGPPGPPMHAYDQHGEMNAHLSEHVNRSNHRANDNPNQPKRRPPPSSVLDKEVERYFDGPLHQEKLSKWEQLSEIPTARELLRPQYVLIDDSHLQEPSDDQPAWEDFNTWGGADGCTAADAIDGQTEDPFAMANAWDQNASTWDNPHAQSTEQSDFAQTTDNAFDVPEPVSEWDAPQAVVNEFRVPNYGATASAFEELSAPDDGAAASGSDEFGASDNDATASGFDEFGAPDTGAPASGSDQFGAPDNGATASGSDSAASEPNGDTNGTDDGRSSTTEVPNHVQEDSQLGDTTIPSSPPSEADGEEPSHGSPEDSTTEQSTNIISDNDADSNANGEDSTNATTVDEVAVKPDDDNEIADLDSQEPSRLQAFNSLGPWPSKKKYLHTHYMLLREDALRHLKEAIQTLRSNPTMTERDGDKSIGIYDDVRVRGLTLAYRGLGVKISFDLSRIGKRIKWDQSSRLVPGSLVVLVPFEDKEYKVDNLVVATVAARPLLEVEQCKIDIFFARPDELEIDTSKRWVMLEERTGFFEAERYTLQALQRMVHESTPFVEQLVEGTEEVDPPVYLKDKPELNLDNVPGNNGPTGKVDVLHKWPAQLSRTLDTSQQIVLQRMLTKRVALCQGPPGTGKTYVSVRALQVMLDNMEKKDPPIIVACHTNHAVDQLLREVHKIAPLCFVRLGGRSQDKQIIKPQTIYELKQREDNPVPRSGITSTALRTIDTLGRELGKMLKPLLSDEKFDLAVLEADGILSNEQKTSLEKEAARWVNAGNASEVTDALKIWAAKSTAPPEARDNMLPMFTYEEVELEREDLEEKEAEAAPADEEARAEYLQGNYLELGESFVCTKPNARVRADRKGKVPKEFRSVSRLVDQTQDLNMVQLDTRGLVYEYLIKRLKESRRDEVRRLAVRYAEAVKQRTIGTWTENAWLLKQHRIVGMTTTGLSKYRGLIAAIKPKVVMIEEAGEVLEAPVIAGALESVQHLILVGDHQQLKPHLHVHELEGAPYHLDRSLLERLVDAGVEYDQLQTQRRMVPEVSRLLGPIYGEGTIKNHEGMSDPDVRPPVPGMKNRLWFFDHQWLESRDGQMSSLNKEEAAMIVGFVTHLYHNGTPLQHITILTFYNGQRRELAHQLRRAPESDIRQSWGDIKIVTVDSYQGEENEVVILSLVRNNDKNAIGFLESVNRACVALSRAKRGFYMFGNSQLLSMQSTLWEEVMNEIQNQDAFGDEELPLAPCAHYEEGHRITQPSDWTEPAPKMGGCDQVCDKLRECGHNCKELCHPGIEHRDFRCHEPCEEQLPCGHPCKLECWDFQHQCGKCPKPRTMSVARPSSPPTDLAGARGSGANAVPVTKPRLPVREAAPSASSATPNGGTRGYQPKPSAARTRPAPEVVSPPPKPKSYSSVATQPRPPAPNSRDLHYPALGSGATPLPPYTRTSPQRRLQANHEKPSTHDTRKDSPDKWDRFVNGGVKVHDAELQALAGAGPAKQETGWDLAASIAKKSDKPASVRTKELSPAKGNGRERKRWRDRHGVGSSDEEQQPPPGPPAIDASSKAQAAPAAPPNLMDEDLLIDLGGDDGQPARRSPSPPRRVVEEGDLIDLMD